MNLDIQLVPQETEIHCIYLRMYVSIMRIKRWHYCSQLIKPEDWKKAISEERYYPQTLKAEMLVSR